MKTRNNARPPLILDPMGILFASLMLACGQSRAGRSTNGEAPTPPAPSLSADAPTTVPLRVDGAKPVESLLDWTKQLLEGAQRRTSEIPSQTPEELLAFLTKAEREGDAAAFAAGLFVQDEASLPWAAGMLLPQAGRRAHNRVIALLNDHHAGSAVTQQAIAALAQRPNLSQARVRSDQGTAGFFLPDGACMMRIFLTPSGWRVGPGSQEELVDQPRNGIPSMLPDLAFWTKLGELVEAKPSSDPTELGQKAMDLATRVGERARREMEKSRPRACIRCGVETTQGNKCDMCALFD